MAEPTIQLGGGNWAGKSDNLLGYYKEGERFYKQDFTFSRSTTGTYTDKDGYIQEMPYNLVTYSEDFTQWTNTRSSDEYGYASPFDKNNASLLISDTTASSSHIIKSNSISIQSGQKYTYSIYLKANQLNYVRVLFADTTVSKFLSAYFNLSSGIVGTTSEGSTATLDSATIENIGDGWFRCVVSGDLDTTTTAQLRVYLAEGDNDSSFDGNGSSSIYIYGAQLVKGTSAKTYFPTTTRLNMPRVDYLNNSNGSLILEPQRSNLVTYSSDFSDSSWFKLGLGTANTAVVTTDYATSPEGLNNATRLQVDLNGGTTSSDQSLIYDAFAVSSGDNTRSIYVKSNDGNNYDIYFGGTLSSYEIKQVTSEWTRIDATRNFASAGTGYLSIGLRGGTGCSDNADILIYGAQVEAGSYPTTLINTSGSSVTRNADACTDGGDASRFNSSEGVLFAEIKSFTSTDTVDQNRYITLTNGTSNERVALLLGGNTNQLRAIIFSSSQSINLSFSTTATETKQFNKLAVRYKSGDYAFYLNGVKIGSSTESSIFSADTLSDLSLDVGGGTQQFRGLLKDLKVYNTALSDSELQTLTTL